MRKEDKLILGILVVVVLVAALLIWKGISKDSENVIVWEGPGGEYKIDIYPFEDSFSYVVYVGLGKETKGFHMRYSPYDVEDIELSIDLNKDLLDKDWIYITRDYGMHNKTQGKASIAAMEFGGILGKSVYGLYLKNVKSAYTTENNESIELQISKKTCEDVGPEEAIVYIKLGSENRVYSSSTGCIIVEGKDPDGLVLSATKLAYGLLGVF